MPTLNFSQSLWKTLRLSRSLVALLLFSFALMTAWSIIVPRGQAPDEGSHTQYVYYLNYYWTLPPYITGYNEANQPPLYYSLVAPLVQPVTLVPVPYTFHGLRVVTALLSTITVYFCYRIGLLATGSHWTGMLAASIVAFLPMFTFRAMNVSNDALVTLTSALATLWIVRLIRSGFTWRDGWLTAVFIALAFLSKINAIFFPLPFALTIVTESVIPRERFKQLSLLLVSLGLTLPWILFNLIQYDDPLLSRTMLTTVAGLVDIKPITSPYFVTTFPDWLYKSFVGVFGWFNVLMPTWVYWLYGIFGIVAILGFETRLIKRTFAMRLGLILLTIPLLSIAVTVFINLTFTQPQGRYLFTALPALALLIAAGLEGIPRWSPRASLVTLFALALLNLYILFGTVYSTYRLPPA